jgi:hypothetical protein
MTDATMNKTARYNGMTVLADPHVPELVESHRQERKWAHRVMWQRGQRFKVTTCRMFLRMGSALIAHPNTVEMLNQQLAKREASI